MLHRLLAQVERYVTRLDRTDYYILAAIAIIIGFLCLRGFGSRTDY